MTAPEPTAVERTIAEVEAAHRGDWQSDGDYGQIAWYECRCEWVAPSEDDPSDWVAEHEMHRAQAVVAAIRNLPPEQMGRCRVSIPAYDVTFTAPDPACGHETSWRQSSWWDAQAGKYRGELVVAAERDHWRDMYEAMRAAARAGIASKITQRTEK